MHSFIDGKHFQVYLNSASRARAAQHATYGAYRTPGKGLCGGYVKPKKGSKHNTGAPSALVMAGVSRGRVSMWHVVPGGRWSGEAAAAMYSGPLAKALSKAWPGKRSWRVLEDNDPTGFKSNKGKIAKVRERRNGEAQSWGHTALRTFPKTTITALQTLSSSALPSRSR